MNFTDSFMNYGEIPDMSLDLFVSIFKSDLCISSGSISFFF